MRTYESPVGPLTIAVNGEGAVEEIRFGGVDHRGDVRHVIAQLDEYFAGERHDFDLTLAPRGTAFQQSVWSELQRIPYGTTISYRDLAQRIARPKAVRACGTANGANPIPIVIPCHRVIGANGTLVGYGGGLHIKRALLALEQPQRALLEIA
jgi:methylated-DNA-[protein]-cysteine S-methyltransferase